MKNVSFFSVLVCDLKRGCLRVAKRRFRHAKEPFYDPKSATFQKQTTSLKNINIIYAKRHTCLSQMS